MVAVVLMFIKSKKNVTNWSSLKHPQYPRIYTDGNGMLMDQVMDSLEFIRLFFIIHHRFKIAWCLALETSTIEDHNPRKTASSDTVTKA